MRQAARNKYQFTPVESQVNLVLVKNPGGKGPGTIFREENSNSSEKTANATSV